MFVHISIHHPKPGAEDALIDSMHRFGAALKGAPGLISVHTLQDAQAGVLVGLALWESREAMMASMMASIGVIMIGTLVAVGLSVPLMAAYWFAPALVVFRDVAPLEAMKASFFACLKNLLPFLVYGVILFVLCLIAMIPIGLGMLIMVPVMMGSIYASYVEIFE